MKKDFELLYLLHFGKIIKRNSPYMGFDHYQFHIKNPTKFNYNQIEMAYEYLYGR